jgi:hypothetical protein
MRNIILMMPVSADSYTLITRTPAGRPCRHSGAGRAGYGRGRPAHQKNAQRSAVWRACGIEFRRVGRFTDLADLCARSAATYRRADSR